MRKKDLASLKRVLIRKRTELLSKADSAHKNMDINLDINVGDEIDTASHNSEKEIYFELVANDKAALDAVSSALTKIEKNIYGRCECCKNVIPIERLRAIPWTRYCIKCQEEAENPKK
jgi:DnaK suppressor protein